MRHKVLIIGFLIVMSCCCKAQASETINMDGLAMVESSGESSAVSFLGAEYGRGLFQISEIALRDYGMYHSRQYEPEDLFDPVINYEIATWMVDYRIKQLLKHYGHEITVENVLQVYNIGIGSFNRGERAYGYVQKYMAQVKDGK